MIVVGLPNEVFWLRDGLRYNICTSDGRHWIRMRAYGCVWCFVKPSVIHETRNFYFDTKEVRYVNSENNSETVNPFAIQ